MAAKWTLPHPRPLAWELKPLSSADTALNILHDGRLELTIAHDVLKGVTPAMLKWWFGNVVGTSVSSWTCSAGQAVKRFRLICAVFSA